MSTLIARLLGRKKPTSTTIADELAKQGTALVDARNRVTAAKRARDVALDQLDKAGMKAADEAQADAERDVALAERAISALQTAHADASKAEAREAFRRDVEAAEREASELEARIKREYPGLARGLASLSSDLAAFYRRRDQLHEQGQKFGEVVAIAGPEDFRAPARSWSVIYPSPEGHGVIQTVAEQAPRGLIRWEDGVPVPAREGVQVVEKSRFYLPSLISLGALPGLLPGDPAFWAGSDAMRGGRQ